MIPSLGLHPALGLLPSFESFVPFAGVKTCACSVVQSCPTLCDPVDCSPPGASVHGILQARILEWAAMSSSRGSSRPRDRTCVSCTAGRLLTAEPPGVNLGCVCNAPLNSLPVAGPAPSASLQ